MKGVLLLTKAQWHEAVVMDRLLKAWSGESSANKNPVLLAEPDFYYSEVVIVVYRNKVTLPCFLKVVPSRNTTCRVKAKASISWGLPLKVPSQPTA